MTSRPPARQAAVLATALLLGAGFGFCLERAGFGSARKLVPCYLDMAVVRCSPPSSPMGA
ncbi:MAG: hypothetical protein IPI48_13700 [bacterium]|nr:hypothetical protein [bacterium]